MKKRVKETTITGVVEEHPIIKRKVDKSLKASLKDAKHASISTGLGASYLGPFALFLGATAPQISLLHGIASLFPALTELFSSHLIEKHSRKRVTILSATLNSVILGLMALLGFLYFFDYANIWALLLLVALFYMAFGLGYPAWFSWMGSLIPAEERGKYLSKRIRIASIFSLITMLLSALVLDFLKKTGIARGQELGFTAAGFILFLVLAALFKLMSVRYLSKQYEPKIKIRKKDQSGLWHFLKNSDKSPLGKFAWFSFAIRAAMGVAAPFYIIFLLQDYQFTYFWYMGFVVSGIAFQILFLPLLGKMSDRFGNITLIRNSSIALAIVPLLVILGIFIPQKGLMILYLLTIPQILSGFGIAGFNLATNNYLYDSSSPQKRGYSLTHLNLLTGTGFFIGTLIASTLSSVKISFLSVSLIAFLLSSILRILVVAIGQRTLQEVREVRPFSPKYFLHEIHPLRSAINQVHHSNHQGGKIIHHI